MKKIRKAVVPAAGYGTRFLPASKAMPKEMLPIVDKPVIQYVIEELAEAGIEQIIIVTGWHKRAIEDHFDRHLELEHKLELAGKTDQLDMIRKLSDMAEFVYVRQKEANGNGGAILTAKNIVGDEPFVVLWGDDFIVAEPSRTKQLINAYNQYGTTILGGIRANKPEDYKRYGYAKGDEIKDGVIKISELIEKPGPDNPPSDLAVVSGSVYNPDIFEALESVTPPPGKEIVYIDGVNILRERGQDAYAIEIKGGRYYDCGNITEYLKTNVEIALKRPDINGEFVKFIKDTAAKL
ncbi:MAG: UTP--glucose-1-phosphate uridylyltransferase [bacterium ADurb.Bin400]|nr:MAG: UTP--glucose-1-phosphate uridylyltransferase [bacterium ADurb.Bin400]